MVEMNEDEIKELLYIIAQLLKEINKKIDDLKNNGVNNQDNNVMFLDEKTEKFMKEYEKRDLANFIEKYGMPKALPNECPKCYEKGKIVKGQLIDTIEFKHSIVYKYKCPVCGHVWVSQIKK